MPLVGNTGHAAEAKYVPGKVDRMCGLEMFDSGVEWCGELDLERGALSRDAGPFDWYCGFGCVCGDGDQMAVPVAVGHVHHGVVGVESSVSTVWERRYSMRWGFGVSAW